MKKILFVLLAIFLAGTLAACDTPDKKLSGADREAVLAFSEAKTDNLMAGLNAGDYAVFSKDFDKPMQYSMQEGLFLSIKGDLDAHQGKYVSRKVKEVYRTNEDYYTVIYDTSFEQDQNVIMRVVFSAQEPHSISGLWFNK